MKEIISLSNISESNLLNLIRYNKALQNKLDINILNYRILSGRYFIGDKNGKGKEYFCTATRWGSHGYYDYLMFEGEYKNGKRNGKGKEYSQYGDIIFEGEYLNGKRNGKGRESDKTAKYQYYVGEYLNGKYWNGELNGYKIKNGNGFVKEY